MDEKKLYEMPRLDVVEVIAEQGFAVSASRIDNPTEVSEDVNYWS